MSAPQPLEILVVHAELPLHDRTSASLRLFRLLELLVADGHRITYLACVATGQERYASELERMGIDVVRGDPERAARLGHRSDTPPLDLEALLVSRRFDVAVLSFFHMAELYLELLRRLAPATRVVVDTVDVHHVRELRGARVSGDPVALAEAERTRERERAVYSAADALVAVSEEDAAALRELVPHVPVSVISNVHGAAARPAPDPAGRSGLLFVGYFGHAPNVDAMLAFCAETWPRVRSRLPGATLTIVGPDPPPAVAALAGDGVEVTGWVPETGPYLDRARVSVAPLRFGAGVKGKIGEALSAGLPVVTTAVGAEGMGLVDGEHALIADDPAAFADAVVALHTDDALWRKLAAQGHDALEAGPLSPAAARAGLRALLGPMARTTFLPDAGADVAAVVSGYVGAFAAGDEVRLLLPATDAQDGTRVHAEAAAALERLGADLSAIPDIVIAPGAADGPPPRRLVRVARAAGRNDAPVVDPANPPVRWREAATEVARPTAAAPAPRVAVLLQDVHFAGALLERLDALDVPADAELLAVVPSDAELEDALDAAGVRVLRAAGGPAGRTEALRRAAQATTAPVLVSLEPHARPHAGFLAPLVAEVEAGAALAGTSGLRVADDGSLWPGGADALAWDCLAARTSLWASVPEFVSREGHTEAQLAAWAREHGPLTGAEGATCDRAAVPPASVIVCTRNRAEELPDCVAALVAHGVVDAGGEIVLVDNASTDDTPVVAARLAEQHEGVRVVHEPRGGLCHARNAGAEAAATDLLLYLDDDARPAPGWYQAVVSALAEPGVVNAGGPIVALWPDTRPADWPEPGLESYLSVLDLGDASMDIVVPEVVYGANWAVRRDALRAVGGFDPAFGPGPDARINGDETSVAWRLHAANAGRTRYAAAAAVGHRIPASRVDDGFLLERALCAGIEQPRHAVAAQGAGPDDLVPYASATAQELLTRVPLAGDLEVEDALAVIGRQPGPHRARILAAFALGRLTGTAVLLGEDAVEAGALRLRVRPEHLSGVLASPARA